LAASRTKKFFFALICLLLLAVLAAGLLLYRLTEPVPVHLGQEPNPVEASEAWRKLKLLNEALAAKRRGFVRLTEVEINSFIEDRYNNSASRTAPGNDPKAARRLKVNVLLTQTNLTVATWHVAPLLGLELPFVWQRTVVPEKIGERWGFPIREMQLGSVKLAPRFWPHAIQLLGAADADFQERAAWLRALPGVSIARNERSRAAELRLYSYDPDAPEAP